MIFIYLGLAHCEIGLNYICQISTFNTSYRLNIVESMVNSTNLIRTHHLIAELLKASQMSSTSTQMSWFVLFSSSFGVVLFQYIQVDFFKSRKRIRDHFSNSNEVERKSQVFQTKQQNNFVCNEAFVCFIFCVSHELAFCLLKTKEAKMQADG